MLGQVRAGAAKREGSLGKGGAVGLSKWPPLFPENWDNRGGGGPASVPSLPLAFYYPSKSVEALWAPLSSSVKWAHAMLASLVRS